MSKTFALLAFSHFVITLEDRFGSCVSELEFPGWRLQMKFQNIHLFVQMNVVPANILPAEHTHNH